jgi:hypothetical protein
MKSMTNIQKILINNKKSQSQKKNKLKNFKDKRKAPKNKKLHKLGLKFLNKN